MLFIQTPLAPFYSLLHILHSFIRNSSANSSVEMEPSSTSDTMSHVLEQFDCVVCYQKMVSPRFGVHCANGHTVCNICAGQLDACPTCRVSNQLGLYNYYFQRVLGDKLVEGGFLEPPLPTRNCGAIVEIRTNPPETNAPESPQIEVEETQSYIGFITTGLFMALGIIMKAIQLILGIVIFILSCFVVGFLKVFMIVHSVLLLVNVVVKLIGYRDVRPDAILFFIGYLILGLQITNVVGFEISQSTPYFLSDKIEDILKVIYLMLPLLHLAQWFGLGQRNQSHTDASNMV